LTTVLPHRHDNTAHLHFETSRIAVGASQAGVEHKASSEIHFEVAVLVAAVVAVVVEGAELVESMKKIGFGVVVVAADIVAAIVVDVVDGTGESVLVLQVTVLFALKIAVVLRVGIVLIVLKVMWLASRNRYQWRGLCLVKKENCHSMLKLVRKEVWQ
jgi:hypothetical protein